MSNRPSVVERPVPNNPAPRPTAADVKPDPMYAPYVDAATSMNASIAAQLLLARPMRPGVFAPEEYFEVDSYFPELEKRKFTIRTSVDLE